MKKLFKVIGVVFLLIVVIYSIIFFFPQLVFKNRVVSGNVTLYFRAGSEEAAQKVVENAAERLDKSPLFEKNFKYKVFLCDTSFCFSFFTLYNYRAGGVAYPFWPYNTFIRPSNLENGHIIGPSGKEVTDADRPLSYFFAHELTHIAEVRSLGLIRYQLLPEWIREGYADYVGKGEIDATNEYELLKSNDKRLNPKMSGLYVKYHLLTHYYLDKQKLPVDVFLRMNLSEEKAVQELRENF